MKHSVEEHLRIRVKEYDRLIRTLIPGYDEMLSTIARWVAEIVPPDGLVIDLGGGTGSLALAIVERCSQLRIEIRDVDPKMLEIAERRLSNHLGRVMLVEASFEEPLPECDAVVATISLHHVKDIEKKTRIYRKIFQALRRRGVFLNGDATMNPDGAAKHGYYRFWSDFMKSRGIANGEVQLHFANWAEEDRYFSLYEELLALASAGFQHPDCFWKFGPFAVIGGLKE